MQNVSLGITQDRRIDAFASQHITEKMLVGRIPVVQDIRALQLGAIFNYRIRL